MKRIILVLILCMSVFTVNAALVYDKDNFLNKTYADTLYYPRNSNPSGYLTGESDPAWQMDKASYYTALQSDGRYLQSFTEQDTAYFLNTLGYLNLSNLPAGGNLSFNESHTNNLYYPLNSNPYNYTNITVSGFNGTMTTDLDMQSYDIINAKNIYFSARNLSCLAMQNWTRYKVITIPYYNITSDITGIVPTYIPIRDTDYAVNGRTNFTDIRFTDTNCNNLNFEIEYMQNNNYADVWVGVNGYTASGVNTWSSKQIIMYYGNLNATSIQNISAVWDSNYVGVYHFGNQVPAIYETTSPSNQTKNNSVYNQRIINVSGNGGSGQGAYYTGNGVVDGGLSTYGTVNGYPSVYFNATLIPNGSNSRTIEVWHTSSQNGYLFSYGNTTIGSSLNMQRDSIDIGGTYTLNFPTAPSGTWKYNVLTYNGTHLRNTKNGINYNSSNVTLNTANVSTAVLGRRFNSSTPYTYGWDDEVRISNVVRSDDYFKFTFYNLDKKNISFSSENYMVQGSTNAIIQDPVTGNIVITRNGQAVMEFTASGMLNIYQNVNITKNQTVGGVVFDNGGLNVTTVFASTSLTSNVIKVPSITTNRLLQSTTGGQIADSGIYYNAGAWVFTTLSATTINSAYMTISTMFDSVYARINSAVTRARLTVGGSVSTDFKEIKTNKSLDIDDSTVIFDTYNTGAGCTGSPTSNCGDYTDQGNCEANNYHGGCSWSETSSASCSGTLTCNNQYLYTSDPYNACTSIGCSYNDCAYVYDEGSCNSYGGCSAVMGNDCYYNFNDYTSCVAQNGCSAVMGNDCAVLSEYDCPNNIGCSAIYGDNCWAYNSTSGGATGLVAYYSLDADASDISANSYDLSAMSAPTQSTGILSNDYYFDGTTDLYYDNPSFMSSTYTLNGWIKTTSYGILIWFSGSPNLWIALNSGGYPYFHSDNGQDLYGGTAINDGYWHMMTMTFDGIYVQCYVDGSNIGTLYSTGSSFSNFALGNWKDNTAYNPLTGDIDEVSIWNIALGTTEISTLYNSGSAYGFSSLSAYTDNNGCVNNMCSFDSGTGICTGSVYYDSCYGNYFSSCSGYYFSSCSGNYCEGTPNTLCEYLDYSTTCTDYGNHAGDCTPNAPTYACSGTAVCQNDEGYCNAEGGCTFGQHNDLYGWLPKCDDNVKGRTYIIGKNNTDSQTVFIIPYTENSCIGTAAECSVANYPTGALCQRMELYCTATYNGDCSMASYPECVALEGCQDGSSYCYGNYYTDCTGSVAPCETHGASVCTDYAGCSTNTTIQDHINAETSISLTTQYAMRTLQCNGNTRWFLESSLN